MTRALHSFLVTLVLLPVVFYRRVLSPMKRAPSCIYLPTCSEYAMEAVKTRGIIVGTALAFARLLRCNPLFHGGYHPVVAVADMLTPSSAGPSSSRWQRLRRRFAFSRAAHRCAHSHVSRAQEQH